MAHPKIMLIDDSSTNNLLYASILSDEGYEVVVCEQAKKCPEKHTKGEARPYYTGFDDARDGWL